MRPGADLPDTATEVAARDAQLRASQGVMDFAELITRASELERAGCAALAAQLYTTWLGHHASELAHVG
ncbi:MAG: hypothetical protein EBR89_11875, partial [Betaproteobacteria bacterium]|nr:hypothetical protein [Betaproteobacteria bacterium]